MYTDPEYRTASPAVFRIRIRIRSGFGRLNADPDPGGKKLPTKIRKSTEISCLAVLDDDLF
jgi:hypothetical protein